MRQKLSLTSDILFGMSERMVPLMKAPSPMELKSCQYFFSLSQLDSSALFLIEISLRNMRVPPPSSGFIGNISMSTGAEDPSFLRSRSSPTTTCLVAALGILSQRTGLSSGCIRSSRGRPTMAS
ncbi:MAG: hypothetical protein U9Q00_01815 [Synergistota bacterium]|nr:hypothetical protein [Synergistota bacterium]